MLNQKYDEYVDVWSVGILTYLLVSGKLPYQGEDKGSMIYKIKNDQPDYTIFEKNKQLKVCASFIKLILDVESRNKKKI